MQSWDDYDKDQQYAMGRTALEGLASFAAGSIKENRDDDKLYFAGKYLDRTFRILVEFSWGRPELELKVTNEGGTLDVNIDFDKQEKPAQEADADWEDDDDIKKYYFLAPGIYLEERRQSELDRQKAMLTGLVPGLIVELIKASNASRFYLNDDKLEMTFEDLAMAGPIAPRMQRAIDLAVKILRELKL